MNLLLSAIGLYAFYYCITYDRRRYARELHKYQKALRELIDLLRG